MSLTSKLRELQDSRRNAGWRIEWIPWTAPGEPEWVFNTPATHACNLIGIAAFCGGVLAAVGVADGALNPQLVAALGTAVGGLGVLFAGRLLAARARYAGWVPVEATCVDREVAEGVDSEGDTVWEWRLLCAFELDGQPYRVTPASARAMAFGSEQAASRYLDQRIDAAGRCRLFVDPDNPLHAVFDRKPRWA